MVLYLYILVGILLQPFENKRKWDKEDTTAKPNQ